jgi:hypothetical protein
MNQEAQEKFLQDKLSEFAEQMKEAVEKVIGEVESEYLPHVLSDTECNVSIQAAEAVRQILLGKFHVAEYGVVTQSGVFVPVTDYHDLATAIYDSAKDKVENAIISELKGKISVLQSELQHWHRI